MMIVMVMVMVVISPVIMIIMISPDQTPARRKHDDRRKHIENDFHKVPVRMDTNVILNS